MTRAMTEKQRVAVDAMEASAQQGVLPPSSGGTRSEFVAVRVAPSPRSDDGGVVCRIVHRGVAIECLRWPDPHWLAALSEGSSDAAA